MNEIHLPDYLNEPGSANYYYGTLEYDNETNSWLIFADHNVTQIVKKLFPGSRGRGKRKVRFYANKRTIGNLNLSQRAYGKNSRETKRENILFKILFYSVNLVRTVINSSMTFSPSSFFIALCTQP